MRRLSRSRLLLTTLALLCASALSSAQSLSWLYPPGPQETSKLTVWIVLAQTIARPKPLSRAAAAAQPDPLAYKESTAGDFGHTAGSTGQTAGSTGTTMGNFGQTAGSAGQTAGSTGTTAGTFQGNVGSKNAGDTGKTMGEFGTSTTDLPAAAAAANTLSHGPLPRHDDRWNPFLGAALTAVSHLQIKFVDVFSDELEARLSDAAGTDAAPDVLLGNPLPAAWTTASAQPSRGLSAHYGLVSLWSASYVPQQEVTPPSNASWRWPDAAILADSRNPQAARAFGLWVEGGGGGTLGAPSPVGPKDEAAPVALRAVRALLQGSGPGDDADPEFADQNTRLLAASAAARSGNLRMDDLTLRVDLAGETQTGAFAAVAVRAVATGPKIFSVAHSLVVLRQDAAGRWRVLQISPLMTRDAQSSALNALAAAAAEPARDAAAPLQPVAQASPPDGDTRPSQPQLWWDNPGGATLQVVEWQRQPSGWSTSNLFFVPDANSRLRTQVQATFAAAQGQYRWRIWSIAKDGSVALSGWRTLDIVGR